MTVMLVRLTVVRLRVDANILHSTATIRMLVQLIHVTLLLDVKTPLSTVTWEMLVTNMDVTLQVGALRVSSIVMMAQHALKVVFFLPFYLPS